MKKYLFLCFISGIILRFHMKYRHHSRSARHKRRNSRQSAFGGVVASVSQVQALSEKIKDKEAAEFAAFERLFDADLRSI